jgi:hypothetical protein
VFEDRSVYVPLLSHHELRLIKVRVNDRLASASFRRSISTVFTDNDYYRVLMSWLVWATRVVTKLEPLKEQLNAPLPINCWVPAEAYVNSFPELANDELVPAPSYYNPIFYAKKSQRFVRIHRSMWCGNWQSIVSTIAHACPSLFVGWEFKEQAIIMPAFGDTLQPHHVDDISKLKAITTRLLEKLKVLRDAGYAHMDIRAPNVLIRNDDVNLIDYDFSGSIESDSLMKPENPSSPPELEIHANSDMWSVGVMLWELVGVGDQPKRISATDLALQGRFQVMPQLAPYEKRIQEFIDRCGVVNPDERLSVDEALNVVTTKWQ